MPRGFCRLSKDTVWAAILREKINYLFWGHANIVWVVRSCSRLGQRSVRKLPSLVAKIKRGQYRCGSICWQSLLSRPLCIRKNDQQARQISAVTVLTNSCSVNISPYVTKYLGIAIIRFQEWLNTRSSGSSLVSSPMPSCYDVVACDRPYIHVNSQDIGSRWKYNSLLK